MWIIIGFIIYLIGFLASLVIMHKFKKQLGIDLYDNDSERWYDDYSSNASAFTSFSIVWPVFWLLQLITLLWDIGVSLSNKIGKWINNE